MRFTILSLLALAILSCSQTKQPLNDDTPREKIAVGDTVYLKSGVKYVFLKKSDEGDFVSDTNNVVTHINLDANGKRVWSTYEPLRPLAFALNRQPMIDGFKEVIKYMRAGDQTVSIIPGHLGYGERGNGPDIPPNATLTFDIEVLSVD